MADAVTTTTFQAGPPKWVIGFTNTSDGTGESAVTKVDISGLTGAPKRVAITQIWYNVSGLEVKIGFDHTADVFPILLGTAIGTGPVAGYYDFRSFGGVRSTTAEEGTTGDILFTTAGHANTDIYWIILEITAY